MNIITTIGQCPLCGGNVIKLSNGYQCENNTGDDCKCGLFINNIIEGYKITDLEIIELLERRRIILNRPAVAEYKSVTKQLAISSDGSVSVEEEQSLSNLNE